MTAIFHAFHLAKGFRVLSAGHAYSARSLLKQPQIVRRIPATILLPVISLALLCAAGSARGAEGEEEVVRDSRLLFVLLVLDRDSDGLSDLIEDPDDDNDGVPDTSDEFPFDPTEWIDTDGDGIGNNTDTDDDNDGVPDSDDLYPDDPTRTAPGAVWDDSDWDTVDWQ